MKQLLGIILTCILFVIPVYGDDGGYSIDFYNVVIQVGEDNAFDIEEIMSVNFTEERHGLDRSIPIKKRIKHLDGTLSEVMAQLRNMGCSVKSTYYSKGNDVVVKIGDPEELVIGKQDYVLSYTYDLGKDLGEGYDEFCFNIIGTEWNSTISGVTFQINMPKAFDQNKVKFSVGDKGSIHTNNIDYIVEGNSIMGRYAGVLNPNEGITIRVELPEGYFNATTSNVTWSMNINIVKMIPLVTLFIIIALWLIFARNQKEYIVPCPYPPEGFNSAEVGMIYEGEATDSAVISLVFSMAQRGYLNIIEISSDNTNSRSYFAFEKNKEYDGEDEVERTFFEGLFKDTNRVEQMDIKNKFYSTVDEVKRILYTKNKRRDFFVKSTDYIRRIADLMTFISYFLVMIISSIYGEQDIVEVVIYALFTYVGVWMIVKIGIGGWGQNIICGIIASILIVGPTRLIEMPILNKYQELVPIIVINIVCLALMLWISKHIVKRTPYGQRLYIPVKGFKDFIDHVDMNTLIKLREENPNYFYDVLPYMIAVDIGKKRMKKFDLLAAVAPTWYKGMELDSDGVYRHVYIVIQAVKQSMRSRPSDDFIC